MAEWIGCLLLMQEVEGWTPTGCTCLIDFSDPVDQDVAPIVL